MYSPGTVLYYLLMQDLYQHRRPSFVNHGVGVTPHKRLFSNRNSLDIMVYLFRRSPRNRMRCLTHGLFYQGISLAKRLAGKRRAPVASAENEEE